MVQDVLPPHDPSPDDLTTGDLLTVRGLKIAFDLDTGVLEAVRGIDFRVPHGKTVALVGESGSGKSVVAQAIMGILPKIARIAAGQILFDRTGTQNGNGAGLDRGGIIDIAQQPRNGPVMRSIRGGAISIIFQEPMTSLSPVHTIGDQVGEALRLHRKVSGRQAKELVIDMLRLVGFPDPQRGFKTYPFELSGGLRQRAMIAMALICRPILLIADEPTTALDVTIQAQILKLMIDLQKELQMALLLITHDLGVVANVADEIVVMYHGEVMESGTMEDLFQAPEHPYLQALLRAVPRFGMAPGERLTPIREIPMTNGKMFAEKHPWPEGAGLGTPLLLVENVSKSFAIRKGGFFGGEERQVLAVDDVSFEVKRGECLGLVGESGCGKTTLSKIIMRALTPDTGRILFNEGSKLTETLKLKGDALQEFQEAHPVRVPGSDRVPQPAHVGLRHHHRAAGHPWRRDSARARGDRQGADGAGRPRHAAPAALSAQLFRRPAPAHRDCTGDRAPARHRDLRRAGLRARRLDPGADPEPAEGPAGEAWPHLHLHVAQSGGGGIYRRPHHGDVRRAPGGNGAGRPAVPEPGPPLYSRPARGGAGRVLDLPAEFRPIDGRQGLHPIGLAGALYHRPGSPAGHGGSL